MKNLDENKRFIFRIDVEVCFRKLSYAEESHFSSLNIIIINFKILRESLHFATNLHITIFINEH